MTASSPTISSDYTNNNIRLIQQQEQEQEEEEQPYQQKILLDQLFGVIHRLNETVDRIELVQRSQAWTHEQISELSYEVKQLKKGVINLQ